MKGFVDFLKLPAYILGAVAIASGILLFAPDVFIQALYMEEFKVKYGFVLGIAFITSVSLLAVMPVKHVYMGISKCITKKRLKIKQKQYLLKMDDRKATIIKQFIQQPSHTLKLPIHDGMIVELYNRNVISPTTNEQYVSDYDPHIVYFLQPWVVERITENKKLQAKFFV